MEPCNAVGNTHPCSPMQNLFQPIVHLLPEPKTGRGEGNGEGEGVLKPPARLVDRVSPPSADSGPALVPSGSVSLGTARTGNAAPSPCFLTCSGLPGGHRPLAGDFAGD